MILRLFSNEKFTIQILAFQLLKGICRALRRRPNREFKALNGPVSEDLHANMKSTSVERKMTLETIAPHADTGYGYKLQYYLFAPIDISWSFKTDFDSNLLLTSDELIGHRLVKTVGNSAITENPYATAPGLRFLWKTVVIDEQYRMDFELLNAEECRHDFHFGQNAFISN